MRLIDADALEKCLLECGFYPLLVKVAIMNAKIVDAESVIRCKDCSNFRQNAHGVCWCDEYGGSITPNDYCSRAVMDKQPRAKVPWEAD